MFDAGNRFDYGFELASQACQRQHDLKRLFTTGYGNNGEQNGHETGEMQHLIRKPYRSDELAAALRTALADGVIDEPT